MTITEDFQTFLSNLSIDNAETISLRYGEITAALNKRFRDSESKTANSLQVGSYGRWTAIRGISDLDMLYLMPSFSWDTYKSGGQYQLLKAARDAIKARYPTTEVRVDRLVVRVLYTNFHIEVQPVFEQADESFVYPDTKDGGSWKATRPREEMAEMLVANRAKNRNLRRLCKMARAWKNKHGVGMGGLLIDTLAHKFLNSTEFYDDKSYFYYDYLCRDFFGYLAGLADQDYYAALGSGQRVKVKKAFQRKAEKAHRLALAAIAEQDGGTYRKKWRKLFGRPFPQAGLEVKEAFILDSGHQALNTEEFIEDRFPVDVRYYIQIDCDVTQDGFRPQRLRDLLTQRLPLRTRKSLRFHIASHNVPGEFKLYWKVLNRGPAAAKRNAVRGQIVVDKGRNERIESTDFKGDHLVECYAVQEGVVVAKDRVKVPISPESAEE